MEPGYRRCCGIDVHTKSLSVCVLAPESKRLAPVRHAVFRTFTLDLKRLRAWLRNCQVTEIVMESTGQYWRPMWNILDGAFERLVLVNPQHVKVLKGRKTDRIDAEWLARHLERDELRGSFIPPREICDLRELTRLRVHWLQDLNRVKNRIGQSCENKNIKISSVAAELFGLSGRKMLDSLTRGDRDAGWMTDYARGSLRGKRLQFELALQGAFTDHQRSILLRLLRQMQSPEESIQALTAQIEKRIVPYEHIVQLLDGIPVALTRDFCYQGGVVAS